MRKLEKALWIETIKKLVLFFSAAGEFHLQLFVFVFSFP